MRVITFFIFILSTFQTGHAQVLANYNIQNYLTPFPIGRSYTFMYPSFLRTSYNPGLSNSRIYPFDQFRSVNYVQEGNKFFHQFQIIDSVYDPNTIGRTFLIEHDELVDLYSDNNLRVGNNDWTFRPREEIDLSFTNKENVVKKETRSLSPKKVYKVEFNTDIPDQKRLLIKDTSNNVYSIKTDEYVRLSEDNKISTGRAPIISVLRDAYIQNADNSKNAVGPCMPHGESKMVVEKPINVANLNRDSRDLLLPKGTIINITRQGKEGQADFCFLEVERWGEDNQNSPVRKDANLFTRSVNLSTDNVDKYRFIPNNLIGTYFEVKKNFYAFEINNGIPESVVLPPNQKYVVLDEPIVGRYIITDETGTYKFQVDKQDLVNAAKEDALDFDYYLTMVNYPEHVSKQLTRGIDLTFCNYHLFQDDLDLKWAINWTSENQCNKGQTYELKKANKFWNDYADISDEESNKLLEDSEFYKLSYCIQQSLKMAGSKIVTPKCKTDKNGKLIKDDFKDKGRWRTLHKNDDLCTNKKFVTFIAKEFKEAMSCLNLDEKEMFPIILHESRFHPGSFAVKSGVSGGVGMGQITTTFQNEFNEKAELARTFTTSEYNKDRVPKKQRSPEEVSEYYAQNEQRLRSLERKEKSKAQARLQNWLVNHFSGVYANLDDPSKSGKCESLVNLLTDPNETSNEYFNSRVCGKNNPEKNLLISGIHYLYGKEHANYLMNEYEKKYGVKVDQKKKEQYIKVMARWMYNGGVSGIEEAFNKMVVDLHRGEVFEREHFNSKTYKGRISEKNLEEFDIDTFKKYLGRHILGYHPVAGNRVEASYFVLGPRGIDQNLDDLQGDGRILKCGEDI